MYMGSILAASAMHTNHDNHVAMSAHANVCSMRMCSVRIRFDLLSTCNITAAAGYYTFEQPTFK